MKVLKIVTGTVSALALVFALGAGDAVAQDKKKKKSRCKDGQPTVQANYKPKKGVNIDFMISEPLTSKPGDPKAGLKWIVHRRLGNCIACHKVSQISDLAKPDDTKALRSYGFHGEVGPPLDGINERYTVGEIRMIIVDPKQAFPDADTIMPSFHRNTGFTRVIGDCKDHVMLSAQQVEDIVAYMKTIK